MNEKDLKNKKIICYAIAFINIFKMVYAIVSKIITVDDMGDLSAAIYTLPGMLFSTVCGIILVVFALKKQPEKFVVLFYINAVGSLLSGVVTVGISLFSRISASGAVYSYADVNRAAFVSNAIAHISLGFFYALCASAIQKQRKNGDGFTKAFVMVSGILVAAYIASSIINSIVNKQPFSWLYLIDITEYVLMALVVKYVGLTPEKQKSGLVNYPDPEEMTDGE